MPLQGVSHGADMCSLKSDIVSLGSLGARGAPLCLSGWSVAPALLLGEDRHAGSFSTCLNSWHQLLDCSQAATCTLQARKERLTKWSSLHMFSC